MRLREEFKPYPGALVFDDWSDFIAKCNQIQSMPAEQACEAVGINFSFFSKVVDFAFDSWRDPGPTSSILHGISYLRLGQVPKQGQAVFIDLTWQTRFLIKCKKLSPAFLIQARPIIKNGKPIIIKGTAALGVSQEAGSDRIIPASNNVLRCLYLYWWLNSQTKVKLPKKIYRGIRAHDLYGHDNMKTAISAIFAADKSYQMKKKDAIDVLVTWICTKKLHLLTDGNLLSFTASIPVAKYFSNGEGIILAVDPQKVDIISSELHDERLQGADYMSKMKEREYIVRIPVGYNFRPEDIIINHLDYFVAEQNPLAVGLLDHDDKEAHYTMNGHSIVAFFHWRDNEHGGLLFKVDQNYSTNRREATKALGFDPLPKPENLSQISNFSIKPRKRW